MLKLSKYTHIYIYIDTYICTGSCLFMSKMRMKTSNTEEIDKTSIDTPPDCSFASNWTIASGSLEDSVNFESSDWPTDFTKKPTLLLKPSASDYAPCEITLTFSQKHEIRQVYVRSTARVYEIYYKPAVHSDKEYLCTVRCSIAAREDILLRAIDNEEAGNEPVKESEQENSEKKSPSSASEDDWVDVKIPESPVELISSLPNDIRADETTLQDFYEATAEISDAEPCVTLVLRLLSLENKEFVYVDEVYVYADPDESTDIEDQEAQNLQGGTAASSLMTMFLPTLLQLTRSNVGRSQDKLISNQMAKEERTEETRNNDSSSHLNEHNKRSEVPDQQDTEVQEVNEVTAQVAAQFQIPKPVFENERQYHSVADCNNHVDRVMEQLISRMSRIEDICLRFEDKMVKPISNMEERLQRVESQLELIVKNTQNSEVPCCTKFSAPAFSSLDSTSSSFYNDGCANSPCVQSEVENHDTSCNDIYKFSSENIKSEKASQVIPSYVVTAPEFSCDEDDEKNDLAEPVKDSPCEKPKQPVSIDDALAAALAGFSSMTVSDPQQSSERVSKITNKVKDTDVNLEYTQCPIVRAPELSIEDDAGEKILKYSQGLKVAAPDFESEDTSYNDKVSSPTVEGENLVHPSDSFATDGGENTTESISATGNGSVVEKEETKEVHVFGGHSDVNSPGTTTSSSSPRARIESVDDDCLATGETSVPKSSSEDKVSILERFEIVKRLVEKTKDHVGTAEKTPGSYFKYVEGDSAEDISSLINFETSILEVKFTSRENPSSRLPLETLLTETDPEIDFRNSGVQRSNNDEITTKASDLSSEFNEEEVTPQRDSLLLVDMEGYDAPASSDNVDGQQASLGNKEQEIFPSLI